MACRFANIVMTTLSHVWQLIYVFNVKMKYSVQIVVKIIRK